MVKFKAIYLVFRQGADLFFVARFLLSPLGYKSRAAIKPPLV